MPQGLFLNERYDEMFCYLCSIERICWCNLKPNSVRFFIELCVRRCCFYCQSCCRSRIKDAFGCKRVAFLKGQFTQEYKFSLYIVTLEFLGELLVLSYRGNIVRHGCAAESYCFPPSDFFCKYDALKQLVFV